MHWDYAAILLSLAIAVPWLGRRRVRQLLQTSATTKAERLALYASTIAAQWFAAVLVLWRTRANGTRAEALGLAIPRPALTIAIAFSLAILVFINQVVSLRRIGQRKDEMKGLLPQLALKIFPQDHSECLGFFALVATVSICEELIYRGFVQGVFQNWSGGVVSAGIVGAAVMFSLAHLYQGRKGLLSTFFVGLIFSAVRAWTGSLLAPMVSHFVADMTVGLLARKFIGQNLGISITKLVV